MLWNQESWFLTLAPEASGKQVLVLLGDGLGLPTAQLQSPQHIKLDGGEQSRAYGAAMGGKNCLEKGAWQRQIQSTPVVRTYPVRL